VADAFDMVMDPNYIGATDADQGGFGSTWGKLKSGVVGKILHDLYTLPERAGQAAYDYGQTGQYNPAPIMESALTAMTGGMPMAQAGAAGIFGGKLAKTADHAALAKAEDMAAKGAPREQIWNDTGWFKGADDKWRFEIDDSASRMNPNTYQGGMPDAVQRGPAAGQLWHNEMFDAYPVLRGDELSVSRGPVRGSYVGALEYDTRGNVVGRFPGTANVRAETVPQAKSVALHEMQHAIQYMEDFAKGADFNRVGRKAYQEAPGEIEARNVQRRMFMNKDERRASPPWKTE
jgi:hypothetical protein